MVEHPTEILPVAAPSVATPILERLKGNTDSLFALVLFCFLGIMIMPLPPAALDMLLALSIALSLLVFLVTLYTGNPVEFSVFPTLLLITTVLRLSINVASTRLILLNGREGTRAAGRIIEAFGHFVVGGNYVVGLVVFIILVIINFVVITKGAGRVAEVAARFTLDALPGKQMAIDAELNSGAINEIQARARRTEISEEADFYGAMDGASKFIRGDAIAGILIVLINIVGGIVVGVLQLDMNLADATRTFTLLTIGDGLVGQIPALIISSAAGMLVTRVAKEGERLDTQIGRQLLSNPRALGVLSVILYSMVIVPGIRVPFSIMGTLVGFLAWQVARMQEMPEAPSPDEPASPNAIPSPEDLLGVEPLTLELGIDLVYLVDQRKGGELLERIQRIRNQFAQDLGVVLPSVHLRDNLRLEGSDYVLLLRGEEIGRGTVHARQHLAIDPGQATKSLQGIHTVDPVFGLDSWWIPHSAVLGARSAGYTVVDVPTVLATHLTELMHVHAHELFDLAQLSSILDRVAVSSPKLVEDLVPEPLSRQVVLQVVRNLIREGVSARDMQTILEALSDYAGRTQNANVLTEFVRQRLSRHISRRVADVDNVVHYIALGPGAEDAITSGLQSGDGGAVSLLLDPEISRQLIVKMREESEGYAGDGQVVILCPPLARGPFRRLMEKVLPRLPIISPAELLPTIKLDRVAVVDIPLRRSPSGA